MHMLILEKNNHEKDKPKTSGSQAVKQRDISENIPSPPDKNILTPPSIHLKPMIN